MTNAWIWPSLCLAVGLVLLIAEVFIPSGGLIGLLAFGLIGVSMWQAYQAGLLVYFLSILAALLPLTIAFAVYLWPRTPMAKWVFLAPPTAEDVEPEARAHPLDHLMGQYGRALTPLRPSGMVDFDGRRLDGMAEEGLIAAGSLVKAVAIRGGQLVVRPAEDRGLEALLD